MFGLDGLTSNGVAVSASSIGLVNSGVDGGERLEVGAERVRETVVSGVPEAQSVSPPASGETRGLNDSCRMEG